MKEIEIDAHDLKTQFGKLLREVEDGAVVHINKRKKHIADIVGVKKVEIHNRIGAALKKIARLRARFSERISMEELAQYREEGRER